MFSASVVSMIINGVWETIYMTLLSTFLAYVLGLPLGVALFVTGESRHFLLRCLNKVLGFVTNLLRSIPFLILLIAILPFTRSIVGTTIGSKATVVPLVIAAAPFIARLVESSLQEVDRGIIEAAESMGSTQWTIIYKVLLPEARPSLVTGAAIAVTTILGYSAMAGIVGGGGLGAIAINYGYYRYQNDIMLVTVILLVIIVQIFQEVGMRLARKSDKRLK